MNISPNGLFRKIKGQGDAPEDQKPARRALQRTIHREVKMDVVNLPDQVQRVRHKMERLGVTNVQEGRRGAARHTEPQRVTENLHPTGVCGGLPHHLEWVDDGEAVPADGDDLLRVQMWQIRQGQY